MSRIDDMFKDLKGKKAFCVYLMSGYPDNETCLEIMELCSKYVDFFELGMPFSDPSADGPLIKTAGTIALEKGASTKSTLELIKKFRKTNNKTPIVWMGYYNSIFNSNIIKEIELSGADGLLTVDLPIEEFKRLPKTNLDIIRLITPTTDKSRISEILKGASGFIYFVSIAGITGTKEAQDLAIKNTVEYIKANTTIPCMVGFGIRDAQKAKKICKFSDGVIVGSALIKIISQNLNNKKEMFAKLEEFLAAFTQLNVEL
ncbi:MAG: tryptophan synthase subunit alpha [Candidatus Gastranaerophilales bacterium]|nr:tryptophan synthase subunit alpha [Candidatus Gastranaerophilales bacterium]